MNAVVEWDALLEGIGLADGGRIWAVSFGWLFNVADLSYFAQWGVPPFLGRGTYSRDTVRAERGRLNHLACVHRSRMVVVFEEVYVAQLFGRIPVILTDKSVLKKLLWC